MIKFVLGMFVIYRGLEGERKDPPPCGVQHHSSHQCHLHTHTPVRTHTALTVPIRPEGKSTAATHEDF